MNSIAAVSLMAGFAYGLFLEAREPSTLRSIAKTIPVATLAIAAVVADADPALPVALGLAALGDWFLAYKGERAFVAGLAAFLTAHLAYCWLFLTGEQIGIWTSQAVIPIGAGLILAAIAIVYRMLWPGLASMKLPVGLYCAVIAAMLVAALGRGPDIILLTGVTLFAMSDTILGFETFRLPEHAPERRLTGPAIWYSYYLGQLLIVHALLPGP